jgi:cadherin-related family protein 2
MLFCPQVVATDSVSNNYSVATVTIHLRNINDHRPVFSQSLYELTVPEHCPTGYLVTDKIQVSDVGWIMLGESC